MPYRSLPEGCQGLMRRKEASRASIFLSREIVNLSKRTEPTQLRKLIHISQQINNFLGMAALEVHMGWIMARHMLWRTEMASAGRRRYLTELIAWRSLQGTNDGMWMAYFLPGIHIFQCFPPVNREPSLATNWFIWWINEGRKHDIPPSQDSSIDERRAIDKWFLDYLAFRDENGPDSTAEMPI
ncbi:uncharacterized protein GGS22DRAFT_186895 [Annulohypoxylon maeteangense]|uniref:uncharacterized protein n=1 Tax=Annulohypoxylon maeteangense TaxID=1927788 RepID=UPI002007F477|nr:uncharacterized protein GGS22DRAFT_186895 [Annulohypoxylon maeteangense]KAI0886823.1 hypothetical protein GGS22DRAFT_186895 [Annulohypoxylon maeteangense]